jgi:thiol:disulfide interchange protein
MKTVKTVLTSLTLIVLVLVSGSAMAKTNAKVIAVINKADWCPVCQNNGERAMSAFMANNKDMAIQFVANDLTNDETKKKSAEELNKLGLDKAIEPYNGTGVTYFFNSETKKLISQVSVAKSNEELASALQTAKKGLK